MKNKTVFKVASKDELLKILLIEIKKTKQKHIHSEKSFRKIKLMNMDTLSRDDTS